MVKINIGILSTARITSRSILNAVHSLPEINVAAIASRDLDKAKEYAKQHKIKKFYGSYEALLKDPEINIIYNPLPNNLHKEWSIRALEAGKNVLCEKPVAANAQDAIQMKKVADETGLLLIEAFHNRYHPVTQRIKDIIDGGQLGTIQHIESHFCFGGVSRDNIRFKYELAGGAFMDLGCYPLNLYRFLCNEVPSIISAKATCQIDQVDDDMDVDLLFPKRNITGKIICSMVAAQGNHSLCIIGTSGILECPSPFIPFHARQLIITHGKDKKKEKVKGKTSYEYQLKALIEALNAKKPMMTSIEDGIVNMQLIDAIYQKAGLKVRES